MKILPFTCVRFSLRLAHSKENLFVPKHEPASSDDIKRLQEFLINKPNTLCLTGAGISTESGIPDYRSEGVGLYARTNHRPIEHNEFVMDVKARHRYWARNFVGWDSFSRREPNAVHHALARFEREARISGVVTQNVDRLHTKAGSKNVIEIHGSGYEVGCLGCPYEIDRHEFQTILKQLNPAVSVKISSMIRPDGDVDLPDEVVRNFVLPGCPKCGGMLKPKIVFFGGTIPVDRATVIAKLITESDALLVLGSSLTVFSGYRMVLQSLDLGIPVALVNIGPTRADKQVNLKISSKCGDVIPKLFKF